MAPSTGRNPGEKNLIYKPSNNWNVDENGFSDETNYVHKGSLTDRLLDPNRPLSMHSVTNERESCEKRYRCYRPPQMFEKICTIQATLKQTGNSSMFVLPKLITKVFRDQNISELLNDVSISSYSSGAISRGFKSAGVWPFNPNTMKEELVHQRSLNDYSIIHYGKRK